MARRKRCKARVDPQLVAGVPTAGSDCGVRTTRRALAWASCDRVRVPVAVLRQRMGKPAGATNPGDWLRAIEHPDTKRQFRQAGLHPPKARLRGVNASTGLIHGSPVRTALNALGNGKMICVAEGYAPWRGTKWQGSFTFGNSYRDDHAVSYVGITGQVGGRESTRYDSLADGRAPGIATGPNVVPWHIVTEAMGVLELSPRDATKDPLGHGLWAGLVIDRAEPLGAHDGGDGGDVDPTPDPTCEDKLAKLQADYDALEADHERLTDAVADAQDTLADVITDLEAASGDVAPKAKAAKAALDLADDGPPVDPAYDVPVESGVDALRDPGAAPETEDDDA